MHVVVGKTRRPPRNARDAGDFVIGAVGHAIMIIDDDVNQREAKFVIAGVVIRKLLLAGPVHRFHGDAVIECAIARKTGDHRFLVEVAEPHGRAGGNRGSATDNGVGAEVAHRKISDVHRAAAALAIAVILTEEFANGPVQMFFERIFDELVVLGGLAPRDASFELFNAHAADRHCAFRQRFAVAAVGRSDLILNRQQGAGACCTAFLADGHVGWAPIIVGGEWGVGAGPELDDHFLKLADEQHVFEEVNRLSLGNGFSGQFLLQIAGVLKRRNLPAMNCKRREFRPHVT